MRPLKTQQKRAQTVQPPVPPLPTSDEGPLAVPGGGPSPAPLTAKERRELLLGGAHLMLAEAPPRFSREEIRGLFYAFGALVGEGLSFPGSSTAGCSRLPAGCRSGVGSQGDKRVFIKMQRLGDAAYAQQVLQGRTVREAEALIRVYRQLLASRGPSGARPSAAAVVSAAAAEATNAANAAAAAGNTAVATDAAALAAALQRSKAAGSKTALNGQQEFYLSISLSREDRIKVAALRGHSRALLMLRQQQQQQQQQQQDEWTTSSLGENPLFEVEDAEEQPQPSASSDPKAAAAPSSSHADATAPKEVKLLPLKRRTLAVSSTSALKRRAVQQPSSRKVQEPSLMLREGSSGSSATGSVKPEAAPLSAPSHVKRKQPSAGAEKLPTKAASSKNIASEKVANSRQRQQESRALLDLLSGGPLNLRPATEGSGNADEVERQQQQARVSELLAAAAGATVGGFIEQQQNAWGNYIVPALPCHIRASGGPPGAPNGD
ncbi:hypothetical protein cyc_08789 [Cyclospora cayetanensis]|uniref:Uncharacterized protein n=1 Tax=Cyclospora cayetanensis TaxID=88456 RepID=A0A1D3D025_9EIME|nr:hypothetical protein cyc_08789 [Cyclospora cayetanensis]